MQINILGFGNMGRAMAKALVAHKFKGKIIASDKKMSAMSGVVFDAGFKRLSSADVIIIAVKPQDIPALANEVRFKIADGAILISIAAGLPIKKIADLFRHRKVVRVMPNLGLAVGQGIATWKASGLSAADKKAAAQVLNKVTENFEAKTEELLDSGTLIYGCGPAYFFLLADSLEKEAVKLGINKEQARRMVQKTLLAAATLQSTGDYQTLISRVASKKGVTEAGLKVFKKMNFEKMINQVILASLKRTKELSK